MDKKWITILGMERSGTSMLSKMFIDSGICMTHTEELNKDECDINIYANTIIHYEDYEALYINECILKRGVIIPNEDDLNKMSKYILKRKNDYENYDIIGFKDPRLSLFYSYWDPFIDNVDKILVITKRCVLSTMKSRKTGGTSKSEEDDYNMWVQYNEGANNIVRTIDTPKIYVIYEYFLYDKWYRKYILEKLEGMLGIKLDSSCVDIKLDHSGVKIISEDNKI